MGLGILLLSIGGIIVIVTLMWGQEALGAAMALFLILGVAGVIFINSPVVGPDHVRYYTAVDGKALYFNNYDRQDNILIIPSHYIEDQGFVNGWKLCDAPMKIEIPDGYNLSIEDLSPKPEPHIIEDGCQ